MNIETFYDDHMEKVYKFFYIKCLNRQIAEDLTSDTFVKFVTKQKTMDIDNHTKYLYGIMRTVWIEFLKDKYKSKIVELENIDSFEDYSHGVVDDFETMDDSIDRLRPYVDRLPEKQMLVLTMRVYEELSVRATAEALGKDANYVKTTYQRALKSLRTMLSAPYQEEVQI